MTTTPITFYINRKLTKNEKDNIAGQLAVSITLNMLRVDTVTIDNDVYSLNSIRSEIRRKGGMILDK